MDRILTSLFFMLILPFCFFSSDTSACTRLLSAEPGRSVLVGRTMDWYQDMQTNLVVYPRHLERAGVGEVNAMHWTSKYGSVVATVFDAATTDGMNERGLATHMLWLDETSFGERDEKRKGLSVAWWAQFYLDNFASVAEAVRYTRESPFQIEALLIPGTQEGINVHLALEDASGDSAIIEYIDGKAMIHHQRNFTVLTNTPSFNLQRKNLLNYKGFGGAKSLPGSTASMDRFVRASYYLARLPKAASNQDSLTNLRSVIDNVAEPFGTASSERPEVEPTLWRTIADLTNKVYYFQSSSSLGYIWVNLDKLNFADGAPIVKLDLVNHPDLTGNVTAKFQPINSIEVKHVL